jgi:HD-GYP domain-containing protein (c-di-GMP phosphodiesterase class II)
MEPAAGPSPSENVAPRLVEVVAAFSLAADLGLGQPMEHGLRSCLIATRFADELHLAASERASIYWITLLAMVGCTADSFELRETFGDDIALRRGMYDVGPSELAVARYFLSRAGSDGGLWRRARAGGGLARTGMRVVTETLVADCEVTGRFAERLGLGKTVSDPLQQKFARWDGKGVPRGLAGEDIALAARVHGVAWRLEAEHRERGVDAALDLAERHAGATLDPNLVAALAPSMPDVLGALDDASWEAVVACEPPRARLTGDDFDTALEALGDFADLKSPWFTGHSRRVAELAEAAGWRLGLSEPEATHLRHAGLVHSLGRTGVPNTVWDKQGPLTVAERERMQLYPYLTDRILRRGSLTHLADAASASQERLDGSGYPRGLSGNAISLAGRVLAAADVYQAVTEARPHRPPMPEGEAAGHLRTEAREGRLDSEATEAVLAAAGHPPRRRRSAPADLTPRELDVLRLIARGRTSAEVGRELGIQPKTVGSHIEHIYAKIGASNRSVATLFAMEHGLV